MSVRFYVVVAVPRSAAVVLQVVSNAPTDDPLWAAVIDEVEFGKIMFRRGMPAPPGSGIWCICGTTESNQIYVPANDSPAPEWRRPDPGELDAIAHGNTPHTVVRWLLREAWAE